MNHERGRRPYVKSRQNISKSPRRRRERRGSSCPIWNVNSFSSDISGRRGTTASFNSSSESIVIVGSSNARGVRTKLTVLRKDASTQTDEPIPPSLGQIKEICESRTPSSSGPISNGGSDDGSTQWIDGWNTCDKERRVSPMQTSGTGSNPVHKKELVRDQAPLASGDFNRNGASFPGSDCTVSDLALRKKTEEINANPHLVRPKALSVEKAYCETCKRVTWVPRNYY